MGGRDRRVHIDAARRGASNRIRSGLCRSTWRPQEAVMCSTGMSPAGISAQLDVLALEEDCSSFRRLGLPRALSGWQTREVQLAWYEMLVLPFNKLLNRGVHKGTLRGRTGKIRVKLAKEHVELYAVPSNPCLIALVHGPQRKLLLLRTPDPETAADWGMFLAGAIAVNWGHELIKHPRPLQTAQQRMAQRGCSTASGRPGTVRCPRGGRRGQAVARGRERGRATVAGSVGRRSSGASSSSSAGHSSHTHSVPKGPQPAPTTFQREEAARAAPRAAMIMRSLVLYQLGVDVVTCIACI